MDIRFSTFLVFVALLRKELRATIAVGPSNTVASIGEQIRLNCTANMVIGYWYLSKNGVLADEVQITQIACLGVIPGFTDHYAVESLGGGYTCNLIVANITMAQAGVYRCQEATNQALSILTVTDPKPAITDNSTTIAVEKENIVIDCVLNYNGSSASNPTLQPYFYWTNSTGQRVTNFNDSTTYDMAFSQLAVTAGRQNIAAYTCHIYLILNPPTTPFYASNTPTVNSGATSRTIEVHYYPAITSLTSTVSITDNCVYKEETLSCSADANPQAQYEWLDLSNDVVTPGATKAISAGGRYQCRAFNDIRSQIHNDTKITNLTTCVSPTNVTISGLGCVKNSCTCMNHTLERLMLTCMANGYPEPTYQWQSDVNYEQKPGYIEVTTDGNYSCTASNKYGSETYNDTASITVSDCTVHLYCFAFKELYICIIVVIFPIYFGLGAIFGVAFVIYIWKTGKQTHYFHRFPFLKKMLPCLNSKTPGADVRPAKPSSPSNVKPTDEPSSPSNVNPTDVPSSPSNVKLTDEPSSPSNVKPTAPGSTTLCERCLGITLYIVMVIVSGVVVIPAMLLMVSCCTPGPEVAPQPAQHLEVVSHNGADPSTKDPASKNANPEAKSQKDAVDEDQTPRKSKKKRKMKETIH